MSIHELNLHESQIISEVPDSYILRVPGGWIYVFPEGPVFVSWNSEFMVKKQVSRFRDIQIFPDMDITKYHVLKDDRIVSQFITKYPTLPIEIGLQKIIAWAENNKRKKIVTSKKNWVATADNWFLRDMEEDLKKKPSSGTTKGYNPAI